MSDQRAERRWQRTALCQVGGDEGAVADEEAQDGGQQHLEGALLRRAQHLHDQRCDGGVHDGVGRGLPADDALQVVQHIHLRAPSAVTACTPARLLTTAYVWAHALQNALHAVL